MRIGFDIDGVLFNQEKFQLKYGISYFKKKYIKGIYEESGTKLKKSNVQVLDIVTGKDFCGKEIDFNKPYIQINSNGYNLIEIFDCSKKEEEQFWYKHMLPYALFVPLRKDASRVMNKLYSEGDKLFGVTARAKSVENTIIGKIQRALVILRLKMARIPYEKIVFCSHIEGQELQDKVSACIDNNLDLMIEDKKSNAEGIENQTNTKTFLYATRNNADVKSKNILRFVNFGELYNGIRKYIEKETFTLLHKEQKDQMTPLEREKYYEDYREYHTKYVYDKDIIKKREKNLEKAIKYGKYVFDRMTKHTIINEDRMPKENGIIITTNHKDMLDIPLVMRTMGIRPYHAILKAEFLDTKAEGFLTDIGCIFVNRHDKSIREQARETAAKRVLTGSDIIVCPEGTRNKTDNLLLKFDFGAVSIAQNTGKRIYPCAIHRANKYEKIINFGSPIEVGINDSLEEKNQILFDKTHELLEECIVAANEAKVEHIIEMPKVRTNKVLTLLKK